MAMAKYEKPQKGNPHRLTVNQHVFPVRSIARFTNDDGTVSLNDMSRGLLRRAKPTDEVFCAKRAWDQRAESGYMKSIEDEFQELADDVLNGSLLRIRNDKNLVVSQFYSLWYMRARHRDLPTQSVKLNGVTEGRNLTKDERELLEKRGVMTTGEGGTVPLRHINAVQLQIKTAHYADQINALGNWGVIQAQGGEFMVPDVPSHCIVPLTPNVCLVMPSRNGTIRAENVAQINQAFATEAKNYVFARELGRCPL